MSELLDQASRVCAALGVLVVVLGPFAQARLATVIPLALEFWTAAGLLRLTGTPSWGAIVAAATILLVRKSVSRAFRAPGVVRFEE